MDRRFRVIVAVSIMVTVVCNAMTCSLVGRHKDYEETSAPILRVVEHFYLFSV
jgi:hypothetical protein